jgi:hypothetical protein
MISRNVAVDMQPGSQTKRDLAIAVNDLEKRALRWLRRADKLISDYPGTFLAASATIGLLIGFWNIRR